MTHQEGRRNFDEKAIHQGWLARRYYFIPHIVALCIVLPLGWLVTDRTPPLELYDGTISPQIVRAGESDVSVTWKAKYAGRDCPGTTQRELIDSQRNLWTQSIRERKGIFHPSEDNQFVGTVTTPPLRVPAQMTTGQAYYRVTNTYYCNWLQRELRWPIVRQSETIPFEVVK